MAETEKPRNRSGYTPEEFEQVKAACLTIAVTLGAYLDDLCIVGGLVPSLLIDSTRADDEEDEDLHPGTNDLDVGLALALLDDQRYAEISARLRTEKFKPDKNKDGNKTVQRWRLKDLNVTVDFLIPPAPGDPEKVRIKNLEKDFGALVAPGLALAFDERVNVDLEGHTLTGERAKRTIPVCGPAAFIVLKALAFGDRGEPKDAYDLTYVIRGTPGGAQAIADRLEKHAEDHAEVVQEALTLLSRDFDGPDAIGPQRAAAFAVPLSAPREEIDNEAADAHGFVDDLLAKCSEVQLMP